MGIFDWLGTSTTNQAQTAQTNPYAPASGPLNSLLKYAGNFDPNLSGTENTALSTLSGNAGYGGSQFAPAITGAANSMLSGGGAMDQSGMINNAYNQYQQAMNPYATGQMSGLNSPEMQNLLDTIQNRVGGGINQMFAASGRDGSGMNQKTYGSGVAEGLAQPLFQQYNQDNANRLAAITGQYGAGMNTGGILSGFNQNANANKMQGIGASDYATQAQNYGPMQQMAIEAQRRGIPLSTMQNLMGIVSPAAQAFGTTTGTTQGTQTMSPVQTFATGMSGFGNFLNGGGNAANAARAFGSDIRLKHDISLLRRLSNGLGLYRFKYNGSDEPFVGVMAQEVEKVRPDAVIRGKDGFLRVYYDRLGLRMQTWADWKAA